MEVEERLVLMEKRLNLIEDEIEKVQKDLNIVGENCKIEVPCLQVFENSLIKKLIKERDENTNPRETIHPGTN